VEHNLLLGGSVSADYMMPPQHLVGHVVCWVTEVLACCSVFVGRCPDLE